MGVLSTRLADYSHVLNCNVHQCSLLKKSHSIASMVSYKVAELKLNCCKFVSGVWQLSDTLMKSAMHAEPSSQSSKFNKNIQQLYVGNRLNTKQRFSLYQETCSGSKILRVARYLAVALPSVDSTSPSYIVLPQPSNFFLCLR